MRRVSTASTFCIVASGLLIPATGCSLFQTSPEPTVSQAADQSKAARPADKKPDADKLARKHDKLQRDMTIARHKLDKARMGQESAVAQAEVSLARAEAERAIAASKLENFLGQSAPMRVARTELALQGSRDGFTEALEELSQLEKMYGEEQFADSTKEIVLQRSRRSIERSRKNLELAERDLTALKEKTLPLEQRELELAVEARTKEVEKLRRELDATRLAQQISVMEAEGEITRIEGDLADLIKEQEQGQSAEGGAK